MLLANSATHLKTLYYRKKWQPQIFLITYTLYKGKLVEMNWPIFTRILPLINVFKCNTRAYDWSFKSNRVPKMLWAYFNNVLIRNYIMLVRHLMLEVNKGWHIRDVLVILLLNTTPAMLQTCMTLDLSNFKIGYFMASFIFIAVLQLQTPLC